MIVLEGRELEFCYDEADASPLFSGVSLQLHAGQCIALSGPSGGGKSTLCYLLAGVIPRSRDVGRRGGQALLLGQEVDKMPLAQVVQALGLVFQDADSQLFSPLVEDEIAFGPENLCLPRDEIGRRIDEALAATGMSEFRLRRVDELSGGQKQLIALAAVLACQPRVLILDEAFSMLDAEAAAQMAAVLRRLLDQGAAVLMVEHEPSRLSLADTVYELNHGRLNLLRAGAAVKQGEGGR